MLSVRNHHAGVISPMNLPNPVPVERAISIYIEKRCTWKEVAYALREETGHFWSATTINSAVNRFRAGVAPRGANWDSEKIEFVKKFWAQSSASAIAMHLGLTRNAVIGMVHRLGLSRKAAPPPEKKTVAKKTWTSKARLVPRLPPPPQPLHPLLPAVKEYIMGQGKPLLELEPDECRWAINDATRDESHVFCGAKKYGDLPFCEEHAARAYNAPLERVIQGATERLKKRTWG